MSKWSGYFKIVTPQTGQTSMTDSQEMTDTGAYNNYTWYQRLVQGSASRMTRYREYDLMDNDVEVSRALDTIAEEMSGNEAMTDEPLLIELTNPELASDTPSLMPTLRAALDRWKRIHDWENRIFSVARLTVKYGDVFFRKNPDNPHKKWAFVHPKNIIAAIVDPNDATEVIGWQVKKDPQKVRSGFGIPVGANQDTQYSTENVKADEMVRFTLNDDMSDTSPFGESVLRPVYRAHKQKELLEDAVIIYRVQRAPERRVFYIDVGKMPPQRVKTYLENIKNEIKQKKIPSMNGGQTEVDSVYNPQSMSEDFFFACISLKTKVFLLDGRTLTLEELIAEHEDGKQNWTYSVDQQTGKLIPGKIAWAGITRRNADMVRVHLDNGKTIDCTPDHKFVLKDGSEVQAQHLTPEMSLMPLYKKRCKTNKKQREELYERVVDNSTGKWNFTHLEICPKQEDGGTVIHHMDYSPSNNNPTNLVELTHEDHWKYHHSPDGHVLGRLWREEREKMIKSIRSYHDNATPEQKNIIRERNRKNGANTWIKHSDTIRQALQRGRITTRSKFSTYEEYCEYMRNNGRSQWTPEKRAIRSKQTKEFNKRTKSYIVDDELFQRFVDVYNDGNTSLPKIREALVSSPLFINHFKRINSHHTRVRDNAPLKFSDRFVYKIVKHGGYPDFNTFKQQYSINHKIERVEWLPNKEDTGCLYVIDPDDNHNFAIEAGVYVKNSRPDGRGSRVDTLPGGSGLGELSDLEYFQRKVWRGLRVPASYMIEQQEGGQIWNDGKVGVAYIQELRFALFVSRLQSHIQEAINTEFKKYIRESKINIDPLSYNLKLPEPQNFGKYKQQELDSQLLNTFSTADGVEYLSKRFVLQRFLQLSDEEIITNERMKREELNLQPDGGTKDYSQLYGNSSESDEFGGGGEFAGGSGLDMDSSTSDDQDTGQEP